MTEQEFTGLVEGLASCNSKLLGQESSSSIMLTVDVDGSLLSEWALWLFLSQFSIPCQQIVFRYDTPGLGPALPGRYWASFHH